MLWSRPAEVSDDKSRPAGVEVSGAVDPVAVAGEGAVDDEDLEDMPSPAEGLESRPSELDSAASTVAIAAVVAVDVGVPVFDAEGASVDEAADDDGGPFAGAATAALGSTVEDGSEVAGEANTTADALDVVGRGAVVGADVMSVSPVVAGSGVAVGLAFLEAADATVGHAMIIRLVESAFNGTIVDPGAGVGGGMLIASPARFGTGADASRERMTLLSRTFVSGMGRNWRIAAAPRSTGTSWRFRNSTST